MSTFSENLRRLRFERHMTQEEFADLLGTTKQNISRYESGAVSPKISTAAEMAEKLGISLSELNGEPAPDEAGAKLHALGDQLTAPSRSTEWRVLSEALGVLEQKNRPAFEATYNYLQAMYPDIFNERTDDDDSRS